MIFKQLDYKRLQQLMRTCRTFKRWLKSDEFYRTLLDSAANVDGYSSFLLSSNELDPPDKRSGQNLYLRQEAEKGRMWPGCETVIAPIFCAIHEFRVNRRTTGKYFLSKTQVASERQMHELAVAVSGDPVLSLTEKCTDDAICRDIRRILMSIHRRDIHDGGHCDDEQCIGRTWADYPWFYRRIFFG